MGGHTPFKKDFRVDFFAEYGGSIVEEVVHFPRGYGSVVFR